MDFNTYIIHDKDNDELIQVHTKITHANLTHVEVVQMLMLAQSCKPDEWSEITSPEDASYKVYAVYQGTISPVFEDDLNCYVFEDGAYAKLQEKLADLFDEDDDDDEEDDDDSNHDDTDKPDIGDKE